MINTRCLVLTLITLVAGKVWNVAKKAVKFGGEIYRTGVRLAAKAVQWLPGVGKPLSKVMDGASEAIHQVTKRIKVKLPDKMEKGMRVLGGINKGLDIASKVGL